jgi:sulfite reductase beta subunit-like hemoprotein
MSNEATAERTSLPEPPSRELVLKRNSVERLKLEKAPLTIIDELPRLIATGYADIPEEDIVRLKWWGLYHDKPKIGTFMLRIKLPAGRITPAQLRAVGELSNEFGRGEGELSTRQTIQLHHLQLAALPQVFDRLAVAELTTAGACGDAVRNVTGCPVAGLAHDELFDVTPIVDEVTSFFYGNPDYSNLPRKHKISISACADRCNAPEINCIALVGAIRDGEEGFAVLVGGGLSSVPRLARELGVFVRKDEALPVLRALLDAWQEDLRYRISRVKARLKFMVDDYGPDGMRLEVERRLGHALPPFTLPPHPATHTDHLGVHAQKQRGRATVGIPVHVGLVTGDRLIALADLADRHGGDVRVTRQQNLVLTGVPSAEVGGAVDALGSIGFELHANPVRGGSIACTGEPHCNFSVTETKTRLDTLIQHLEARFGPEIADLRLHLDGCPHACAQHWVGDLGFQGTTIRDESGKRRQAYEIYVRGALGADAAIGRPLFRRVPSDEMDEVVAGLVGGWVERRAPGESFPAFATRSTDEELAALAGIPAAPRKARDLEEAA